MEPMKIKNIQKLQEFSKLPMNWNENGALPFSTDLIERCKEIINILPIQPEIFPTAANSIQMEYEKENGEYLEFNVYSQDIEVFMVDAEEKEEEYSIDNQADDELRRMVKKFYASN